MRYSRGVQARAVRFAELTKVSIVPVRIMKTEFASGKALPD
jgi:hypothetical protein